MGPGVQTAFIFLLSLLACVDWIGGSNVYRSYQTTIYCNASAPIQEPRNVSSIVGILQSAHSAGQTVKAFGSRHSITDVICTEGIPIFMGHINHKQINADGSATFGAGIELQEAMNFLESQNLSLITVPGFGGITIGGAIGTGAHGSSLKHPSSISDQVLGLTVVVANGSVLTVSSPEEVNVFRVHLGLLGIIVDVTLSTVPLFKMKVHNYPVPEACLFDNSLPTLAAQYDMFEAWWFPASGTVVLGTGNYTSVETPGNATSQFIPNVSPLILTATSTAFELLQDTRNTEGLNGLAGFTELSLYTDVVAKPPIYSEDGVLLQNPGDGYAWRLMSSFCGNATRGRCSWLNGEENSILPEESSVAFDISEFTGVMSLIRDVLQNYPASFALVGVYIRFSISSPALMAISSGRTTFTVEWTTPMRKNPFVDARDGIGAYQMMLQEMVTNYGGRPHWGKNGLHFTTQSVLSSALPNRLAFLAAMEQFDPSGAFMNKFGRRIQGISDAMDVDPLVNHCALQDYCVCSTESDCAAGQACVKTTQFAVCQDLPPVVPIPIHHYHFNDLSNLNGILNTILNFFPTLN